MWEGGPCKMVYVNLFCSMNEHIMCLIQHVTVCLYMLLNKMHEQGYTQKTQVHTFS